ncbi:Hypothetical predicted protein [Olea europaea subsp. europaea]|uniref:Uncharacterized protein n=1 Tax=Olea europaea subsp. europaea TaxID=158383 RepID=A0A8S0THZ8_OLEEU|nr:Hypothetical predicted protein [Olea europaea subsp. europaea]
MANFRENHENIYETSYDLGLLNVPLAFEDTELQKIVNIVKNINIGNNETIMTIKSDDEELKLSEPMDDNENISDDDSDEEIIIHERFNTNREPIIVIREPKQEQ